MVGEVDRERSSHFNGLTDRCGKSALFDAKREFGAGPAPVRRRMLGAAAGGLLAALFGTGRSEAAPPSGIRLLVVGQSLGAWWDRTPAWDSFVARLRATGETRDISWINAAAGGSAALKRFAPTGYPSLYWWDETTTASGPLTARAIRMVQSSATKPNVILWVHGERDSAVYPSGGDDAFFRAYYNAVSYTLGRLRLACSPKAPLSIPVIIQRLGPRSGGMEQFPGMAIVREAQAALVGRKGWNAHWGARPDASIALRDQVHPTDDVFAWFGDETADAIRGRVWG